MAQTSTFQPSPLPSPRSLTNTSFPNHANIFSFTLSSAFFNNITYKTPTVPTLYTTLSAGDLAANVEIYGSYTHSFVLEKGQVVQIVVDNDDTGKHPFHLHGHNFQVMWRSEENAGFFADSNVTEADFPEIPMRRDTMVVYPQGFIVLRFVADNPGTLSNGFERYLTIQFVLIHIPFSQYKI